MVTKARVRNIQLGKAGTLSATPAPMTIMQVVNMHHAGQLFPCAAPPAAPEFPQAPHRHDAEIAAPPQARGLEALAEMGPGYDLPPHCCGTTATPSSSTRTGQTCRAVFSGKVYYDLFEEREKREILHDVLRSCVSSSCIPFPEKALNNELSRFPGAEIVWCQEEPKNMGGWSFGAAPEIEAGNGRDLGTKQQPRALCRAGRPRPRPPPACYAETYQGTGETGRRGAQLQLKHRPCASRGANNRLLEVENDNTRSRCPRSG